MQKKSGVIWEMKYRFLLISAYDWSEFEAEAREAGISGFISKPLFKSTLYHALRQYMGSETEHGQTLNPRYDLSGRRILLAEDNELNWEVAKELLSDLGVELDWAEDGRICLDKVQKITRGVLRCHSYGYPDAPYDRL